MPFDPDDPDDPYTWPTWRPATEIIDAPAQDAIDDHRLTNPRKRQPVATGVLAYFPDAILEVARVSEAGNRQHGTVGWDRTKSTDEFNALVRHLIDHLRGNLKDSDGQLHLAKAAWRALAALQRHMDSVK